MFTQEQLGAIRIVVTESLQPIYKRFDTLEKKMDEGFTRMDEGFEKMDEKMDLIEKNLIKRMDDGFEIMDKKIDIVEKKKSIWVLNDGGDDSYIPAK